MDRGFELTCKMREDLLVAYRDVYTKCHSQKKAYEETVNHEAPRFYISPSTAYKILRRMVVGDFSQVEKMDEIRQRMYMELFAKLQKMSQRKEYIGKSLWFICQFLVAEPASEFYISANTFKDIFISMKKHGKEYRFKDTRSERKNKKLVG